MNPPCYARKYDQGIKITDFESLDCYAECIKSAPDFPLDIRGIFNYLRCFVDGDIQAVRYKKRIEMDEQIHCKTFYCNDIVESFEFEGDAKLMVLCYEEVEDRKSGKWLRTEEPIAYTRVLKSGEKINIARMYEDENLSNDHIYFIRCKNPVVAVVVDFDRRRNFCVEPVDIKRLGFVFDTEFN